MPSNASSSFSKHREPFKSDGSKWSMSLLGTAGSRHQGLLDSSLDMKDLRPVRKWSSLSKLSTPATCSQDGSAHSAECKTGLDKMGRREETVALQLRTNGTGRLHNSMELLKIEDGDLGGKRNSTLDCKYKFESCSKEDLGIPDPSNRIHALDMTYSALPESKPATSNCEVFGQGYIPLRPQAVTGVPIQPSERTQRWLTEQFHTNPPDSRASEGSYGLSSWQLKQLEELKAGSEYPLQVRKEIWCLLPSCGWKG